MLYFLFETIIISKPITMDIELISHFSSFHSTFCSIYRNQKDHFNISVSSCNFSNLPQHPIICRTKYEICISCRLISTCWSTCSFDHHRPFLGYSTHSGSCLSPKMIISLLPQNLLTCSLHLSNIYVSCFLTSFCSLFNLVREAIHDTII